MPWYPFLPLKVSWWLVGVGVGGSDARPILMSAPGPFPLKGEIFSDLRVCFERDLWTVPRDQQLF